MTDEKPTMPTAADVAAGGEVVNAGATAAAAEQDPAKRQDVAATAIKETADAKGFKLSAEDAQQLAGMVTAQVAAELAKLPDQTADKISERGGFDRLPEPVAPPPAPTGSGARPVGQGGSPDEQPPTGRPTFASRFRSG